MRDGSRETRTSETAASEQGEPRPTLLDGRSGAFATRQLHDQCGRNEGLGASQKIDAMIAARLFEHAREIRHQAADERQ